MAPGIVSRGRKLKGLFGIKFGPGAAILPPEITRLHMDFAKDVHDGHYGPRKFWRNYLPRLKYHNPAISMTINRTENQLGPAIMTIHYTSAKAAASTAPAVATTANPQTSSAPVSETESGPSTEKTQTINMKHRQDSEILDQLIKLTNATPVLATPEEEQEMQELEEANAESERLAERGREINAKRKKELALLQSVKGMMA